MHNPWDIPALVALCTIIATGLVAVALDFRDARRARRCDRWRADWQTARQLASSAGYELFFDATGVVRRAEEVVAACDVRPERRWGSGAS